MSEEGAGGQASQGGWLAGWMGGRRRGGGGGPGSGRGGRGGGPAGGRRGRRSSHSLFPPPRTLGAAGAGEGTSRAEHPREALGGRDVDHRPTPPPPPVSARYRAASHTCCCFCASGPAPPSPPSYSGFPTHTHTPAAPPPNPTGSARLQRYPLSSLLLAVQPNHPQLPCAKDTKSCRFDLWWGSCSRRHPANAPATNLETSEYIQHPEKNAGSPLAGHLKVPKVSLAPLYTGVPAHTVCLSHLGELIARAFPKTMLHSGASYNTHICSTVPQKTPSSYQFFHEPDVLSFLLLQKCIMVAQQTHKISVSCSAEQCKWNEGQFALFLLVLDMAPSASLLWR